jgi:hypothetical protein
MSGQGKPARFFELDEVGHEKAATGELRRTGKQAERRGARERVEWAESGRDLSLSSAKLFLP